AFQQGRDCVIFLVDASPPMHAARSDGGSTSFQNVLLCIVAYLLSKIINNDTDYAAVVLFGTRESQNSHGFEHINVYQALEAPYAKRISDLEALIKTPDAFEREIGASNDYALHEALWICNTIFSKTAKKADTKRIFILTNNDTPNAGRIDLQRSAITRAGDLHDTGTIMHLFYFDPPERRFDCDAFYKEKIIKAEDGEENFNCHDATGKLEELMRQVRQKEFKKRTAFKIPFILGDGFEFGVNGYNLFNETKISDYTYLVGATNEEAQAVTSYVCKTTAQLLSHGDMDYYYVYGGKKPLVRNTKKKVIFTQAELATIRSFGDPGLRLIGFKPLQSVLRKPYYNLKHSAFIYPDEVSYTGSSAVFVQLLARLVALEKAAICSFIPRKNAAPRLVALLPQLQLEEFDDRNNLIRPSGFHLIHIPFADDIRKPPAPEFDPEVE
ncbi:X-ray repair cross-complementing protein 6, partial [Cladochytrium tenue]